MRTINYTTKSFLLPRQQLNIRSGQSWLNAAQKAYGVRLPRLGATPSSPVMTAPAPVMEPPPQTGLTRCGWIALGGAALAGLVLLRGLK